MQRLPRLAAVLVAAAHLAACGGDDDPPRPPSGWIDVPGMICGDGSPTGIGISPGSEDAVLVFLNGGGACWSEAECDVTTRGPFGRAEYDFLSLPLVTTGTIFDRTLPGNPFADWTIVFVPYCTGDVHVGRAERTYGAVSWQHHGWDNLVAAVDALSSSLPPPARLAVTGSSAGGFGSLLAFDLVRAEWPAPATAAFLVDDSGPTLVGDDLPLDIRSAWWSSWNLGATVSTSCPACRDDLSAVWPTLSSRHPDARLALLGTTQDATMMGFFRLNPASGADQATFAASVATLADRIGALPNAETFRVSGSDHVLFFKPAAYSAGGKSLLEWLGQQVDGDSAWSSAGP
jgi:hypothetical protein